MAHLAAQRGFRRLAPWGACDRCSRQRHRTDVLDSPLLHVQGAKLLPSKITAKDRPHDRFYKAALACRITV